VLCRADVMLDANDTRTRRALPDALADQLSAKGGH